MKVADLLEILNITKQSLGRVLKQLVDQGYVLQKEGAQDRRQRLLYRDSEGRGPGTQARRRCRPRGSTALSASLDPNAHEAARRFLTSMIDTDNREDVLRLIAPLPTAPPRREADFDGRRASAMMLARHASRRRATSAGGRRRPPYSRSAFALSSRRRLSCDDSRNGDGRARQAERPQLRSAHPRCHDARRIRFRFRQSDTRRFQRSDSDADRA